MDSIPIIFTKKEINFYLELWDLYCQQFHNLPKAQKAFIKSQIYRWSKAKMYLTAFNLDEKKSRRGL